MRPAAAASTVPRRATSVRGQTTAVVMAGRCFASLDELVKHVVIGGMADKRVNGNGFSQRGKVAHGSILLPGWRGLGRFARSGVLKSIVA